MSYFKRATVNELYKLFEEHDFISINEILKNLDDYSLIADYCRSFGTKNFEDNIKKFSKGFAATFLNNLQHYKNLTPFTISSKTKIKKQVITHIGNSEINQTKHLSTPTTFFKQGCCGDSIDYNWDTKKTKRLLRR